MIGREKDEAGEEKESPLRRMDENGSTSQGHCGIYRLFRENSI